MLSLEDILGSVGVVNTLDLDQAGLGVRRVAVTLVGKVTTPVVPSLSAPMSTITFWIIPCPWRIVVLLEQAVAALYRPPRISVLPGSQRFSIPFQAPHYAFGSRPRGRESKQSRVDGTYFT